MIEFCTHVNMSKIFYLHLKLLKIVLLFMLSGFLNQILAICKNYVHMSSLVKHLLPMLVN